MSTTQITTGKVRFSYCSIFEPRAAVAGGQEKYSVTLLIPKTDKATIQKIKTAIEAAKQAYFRKTPAKSCRANLRTQFTMATENVQTAETSDLNARAVML